MSVWRALTNSSSSAGDRFVLGVSPKRFR